jgi:hypothetical protein
MRFILISKEKMRSGTDEILTATNNFSSQCQIALLRSPWQMATPDSTAFAGGGEVIPSAGRKM